MMTKTLSADDMLSKDPDGLGFYYGFLPEPERRQDGRQINVRSEQGGILRWMRWYAYVGGERVGGKGAMNPGFRTKQDAVEAAVAWMHHHPPGPAP
jgi:hypothetical protein